MAEAANKILKYRYLFPNPIADTGELVQVLDKALADYNQICRRKICMGLGLTKY
jgi:putative transposase